ncbi:hypothetical protein [Streptomyces sp. NPDC059786]|uniref:hypothetical protein n=1 Tax=Streptomyces sp. NPDC059786 TaxID=3346946 RepID=UPI0036697682
MTGSEPRALRLTEVLAQEADALTATVTGGSGPPAVLLARARRAFVIAQLVSTVLAEHAVPARDAYDLGGSLADAACNVLDPVIGPELIAACRADLRHGEAGRLLRLAEVDVTLLAHTGEPEIDDAMAMLSGALATLLAGVAGNEQALVEQRRAAGTAEAQARELWARYGDADGT